MSTEAPENDIVHEVWADKYRYGEEGSILDTRLRVAKAVANGDEGLEQYFGEYLLDGDYIPAGRIHAGAGTDKRVTLINCYVSPLIQDSLATEADKPGLGILESQNVAAFTQQMGGGIGMGFSPIRPARAKVVRTGSVSSGVIPFMSMWDSMCSTIMSSGSRRGAMMGTMICTHPDIKRFITAKREKGVLEKFNVSVLVTDEFMEAVREDKVWNLFFHIEPHDGHLGTIEINGVTQYIYEQIRARDLWQLIIKSTYDHAEPGVIFVDRVNEMNNLHYCEYIDASNPCGEQMLPPNGACNLGHINLALLVLDPFTENARFDWERLDEVASMAVTFQDRIIDVSKYPTEEQKAEAENKRRLGIGYTALGNALQMLRIRYGSAEAKVLTSKITKAIAVACYRRSITLAQALGAFPAFEKEEYLKSKFIQKMPKDIQDGIREHGIRNAVLLSIAPVGTMSIVSGNLSSGIEPSFSFFYNRKVLKKNSAGEDYYDSFEVRDWGWAKFMEVVHPGRTSKEVMEEGLPDYMVTALELGVDEHLEMQAVAQEWIDSSISKTINIPTDYPYEDFQRVYERAHALKLKGVTTYRPNPESDRGSVLSVEGEPTIEAVEPDIAPMEDELEGRRYRIKWPGMSEALYVNINDWTDSSGQRRPFEIFVNSKSVEHDDWIKALTLTVTGQFRRGGDISFIATELQQIHSAKGGQWVNGKYIGSLPAYIGQVIEKHLTYLGLVGNKEVTEPVQSESGDRPLGQACPSCGQLTFIKMEGCMKCTECGHSACG